MHHNVETAESYYDEVSTTVRYEGRIRTIQAVRDAGLETCVGGILNLGESPEQRVEMAFELAALNPTSVPINLLIPKAGTKFGDREILDPWEAVKWVAIFRLVLPDALFRLCGGRVENLAELQPLAVKRRRQRRDDGQLPDDARQHAGAGPRDVRGRPGLNIARQPDNGANPRPDNRSGHLDGETPDVVEEFLDDYTPSGEIDLTVQLWDPSTQLRYRAREKTRPAAARRRAEPMARGAAAGRRPGGLRRGRDRHPRTPRGAPRARPLPPHAHGQRPAGPARRARRQAGAAAVLEQLPRARRSSARA